MRKDRMFGNIFTYFVFSTLCAIVLIPYVWMLMGSFKERVDLFSIPPKIVFSPTIANYIQAFVHKGYGINLRNTIIVAALSTLIAILVGVPGAYGLSRRKMRGDSILLILTLVIKMAPPIIIAVPFYILVVKLKLLSTLAGVIMAHSVLTMPLLIWMMKNFFDAVPRELEEAAIIDGCTKSGAFRRVSLPLVLGGLSATVILCIITSWNEYLLASVLTSYKLITLPVAIPNLITSKGTFWGEICAIGTVVSIPIAIFTLAVQKYLVKGMTMGAIK